eukprot:13060629-Alexandrium_andersonii.AAC.1
MVRSGGRVLKAWGSTQSVIATSSGEAEYYGMVKGASQAVGIQAILGGLGAKTGTRVGTDSSAAKG